MNDPSMLIYNHQFPQIPDFPCMSSSSSNPAPVSSASSACSVSSYTSSAVLNVKEEEGDGNRTIDCMDVMENFGYMDLIEGNEIWDPCSVFEQNPPDMQQESEMKDHRLGVGGQLDELGVVFFEWLKSNKESVSAEDMRNIKIKKSTVECASKRLGSSKEGKKQLLKLILEWVQQHQLQRKNSGGRELPTANDNPTRNYPLQQSQLPGDNVFPSPYPRYMTNQVVNGMSMVAPPLQPSTFSYMGGDYNAGLNSHINRPYNNTGFVDYQVLESAPSWNPSQIAMAASPYNNQFPDVGNNYVPQLMPLASCYPDQYPYNPTVYAAGVDGGGGCDDQRVMRLGLSATKEARKKRMARQRRTYFHHHHHSRQNENSHQNHEANSDKKSNCSGKSHGGNWLYWSLPPSDPTTIPPPPMEAPHQSSSKQTSSDKRPELKTEKNLKFLLQKVLKQSDVGSLGRIVLPKKEAESHLPELDSRDGISIAMEDIGTSQVWNMRYRFWPNNKSRMYLLENTGDFVNANGLQEGDFIVIYSDVKCGKYLIRGVKVRQPATGKLEGKKPVKRSYRSISQSARSSPSPVKIAAI